MAASSSVRVDVSMEYMLSLLDKPSVLGDERVNKLLGEQFDRLMKQEPEDVLSDRDQTFHRLTQKLLDESGNVRSFVVGKLAELVQSPRAAPSPAKELSRVGKTSEPAGHSPNQLYDRLLELVQRPQAAPLPMPYQEPMMSLPREALSFGAVPRLGPIVTLRPAVPVPPMAFGREMWAIFLGDVDEEPPLPPDIQEILVSHCPFHSIWPRNTIAETHVLVLIPSRVNGQPLTIQLIGELVKHPRQGNATRYSGCDLGALPNPPAYSLGEYTEAPVSNAYWILMTRNALNWTEGRSYVDQQAVLAALKTSYKSPRALEAVVGIFTEYVRSGDCLYGSGIYTRCQEQGSNIVVGDFSAAGLSVRSDIDVGRCTQGVGLGAVRQFRTYSPNPVGRPLRSGPVVPIMAFGKAMWAKYFGEVDEEPPLPPDVEAILNAPCPFWPDKKVCETHMLTLIPAYVNGQPFTLRLMGELVQDTREKNVTNYKTFSLGLYTDPPVEQAHWVLMTRKHLPPTGCRPDKLPNFLSSFKSRVRHPYDLPSVLHAVVSIFAEYARSGIYLYGRNPGYNPRSGCGESKFSAVCCREMSCGSPLIVGHFLREGLLVGNCPVDDICVAAARRLQAKPSDVVAGSSGIDAVLTAMKQFVHGSDGSMKQFVHGGRFVMPPLYPVPAGPTLRPGDPIPAVAFGKAMWTAYLGDVDEEPLLPANIVAILARKSLFESGKTIGETHVLVLIPSRVNGRPLTVKFLEELVKIPRKGNATRYAHPDFGKYEDLPVPKSYWILMARKGPDALRRLADRGILIKEATQMFPYEVPRVLEVVVSACVEHVRSGEGCDVEWAVVHRFNVEAP